MVRRIFVFFAGVFLALFLLEVGLRLTGFIVQHKANICNMRVGKNISNPYVVLCLGNSYTKGTGAPPEMSYPAQLQRMFIEKFRLSNILVINNGIGGQNSTELLRELPENIRKFNPKLIVLQTGQVNKWDHSGFTDYLKRKNKQQSFARLIAYRLSEYIYQCRVYKLFILFCSQITTKFNHPAASLSYRSGKEYIKAKEFADHALANLLLKNSIKMDQLEAQKALDIFTNAMKVDPAFSDNYISAGIIYRLQSNYAEALECFFKGVSIGLPNDHYKIYGYQQIRDIRMIFKGKNNSEINKKIEIFISKYNRENLNEDFNLFFLSDSDVSEWVESDIREIVKIIRRDRIGLILHDYPLWDIENATLLAIADELRVPFVSNFKVFQEKISLGMAEESLFVLDGHCNGRGYGLMAANVFNEIVREYYYEK